MFFYNKNKKVKKCINDIPHRFDSCYYEKQEDKPRIFSNKFFGDVNVRGVDNLVDNPLIFVSNHKSLADVFVKSYVFVELIKKGVFNKEFPKFLGGSNLYVKGFTKSPSFFGLPDLKKFGMVSIDRSFFKSGNFSYKRKFFEYMVDFFKKEDSLVFYPEGGRSYDGSLKPFEEDLFNIIKKNCDDYSVIPVFTGYEFVIEAPAFNNRRSTKNGGGVLKNFLKIFLFLENNIKMSVLDIMMRMFISENL